MSSSRWILVRLASTAVLIAATTVATAQQPPPESAPPPGPERQETTDEAAQQRRVEALRGISAERRDEAVATARRAAEDLDRQMERLQRQMDDGWDRMSQVTRARTRTSMADLRQRRTALAEWLGGMRHSSGAAWSEVRSGFVKSYEELAEATRKARAEFARDQADRAPDTPRPETDRPDTDGRPH